MKYQQMQKCVTHSQSIEYFCEKCLQPICSQCIYVGPHNTQIHLVTNIANAYERKVYQLKEAITQLLSDKSQTISKHMIQWNKIIDQNKKFNQMQNMNDEANKNQIISNLQQVYEANLSNIQLYQQQLQQKMNQMNQLGYNFQLLKTDLQIVTKYDNVNEKMKQVEDKLKKLLTMKVSIIQLPKKLTEMRFKLAQIQAYKQLHYEKLQLIKQIIERKQLQTNKINIPFIDYQNLLKELNNNLSKIEHTVCNFCGAVFDFQMCNTQCAINKSNLNHNQFVGYCDKKPDLSKWATNRHYFSSAKNVLNYFKTKKASFGEYFHGLLLKIKALCAFKKINICKLILQHDPMCKSFCEKIVLFYLFVDVLSLTKYQADVMLSVCEQSNNQYIYYSPIIDAIERYKFE